MIAILVVIVIQKSLKDPFTVEQIKVGNARKRTFCEITTKSRKRKKANIYKTQSEFLITIGINMQYVTLFTTFRRKSCFKSIGEKKHGLLRMA